MKKWKYLLLILLFSLTGCLQNDSMEDIDIETTAYPIQYVTERLYQEHGNIKSIYPNGSTKEETVSDKLLEDYSANDLFIFVGANKKEQDYLSKMLEHNKKLKMIDASISMSKETINLQNMESLWLDPMNLLTMANDIKKGFEEYTSSAYLINDIEENYQVLKQDLIQLDADYSDMASRANKKTIIVTRDAFQYLEKYGIEVISLEENENLTEKTIHTAEEKIKNKEILYIYTLPNEEVSDTVKRITQNQEVTFLELHNLYARSEEEASQDLDYLSLMRNNLEALKKELYR